MADSLRLLNAATARILKALIRILLRNGVVYDAFSELAKHVYVDVAEHEFPIEGRKISSSRIAALTGIHRREVARLRGLEWDDDEDIRSKRNRAANVLGAWLRDKQFLDRKGDPRELPADGPGSFTELVTQYSGDIPPRAIADELKRLNALIELPDGKLRLTARSYVPTVASEAFYEMLGTDTSELIETIDANMIRPIGEPPRYHNKVVYFDVPEEYVEVFGKLSARMGQRVIEELDRWLADHDRTHNPDILGSGRTKLGLIIYQIEQVVAEQRENS